MINLLPQSIIENKYCLKLEYIYDGFLSLGKKCSIDFKEVLILLKQIIKKLDKIILNHFHDYTLEIGEKLPFNSKSEDIL